MKNESGAINIKVGQSNLSRVQKAAKKLGMTPSRLAKVLLMDAINKIDNGVLKVSAEPQVLTSEG